ncbi:ankyrin repeat-containing domain protein, partial [Xylaria flabelliformis]
MDPLSITASIIAVITAVGQVTKGLRTLNELRHAPQEVLALADEVNEFQALTYLVQKATRNVSTSDLASEDRLILKKLLDSAKEPLEELDELIAVCIRKADTGNNERGVCSKISYKAWIKSRKSIGSLKKRLLRAHRNIGTALIALGNIRGQAENQLIMNIYNLVLNQAKESETPTRPKEYLLGHLEYKVSVAEDEVMISTDHRPRDPSATFTSSWVALSIETCAQTCRCQCHCRTRLESSRWSKDILGTLFYSYVGARPCNMVKCIQPSSSYQLTYHFPRWILKRTFTIDVAYRSSGGLSGSWSISFPRAISVSHKVWQHIQQHDSTELRRLLRQRVVYVNDMADDDGTPLLTYALKFRSYDIVGLLLEYGANLDLVDPRGIHYLIDNSSARAYAQSSLLMDRPIQRPLWSAYIGFNTNELDVHNDLCFNPLHYIIIGLEKADLRQQLRLNRAYVDSADAFGRSPLHWAVITGNVNAVEALIEYGASTTCVDKQQMTPLHAVFLAPSSVQVQCGRLLVDAGADVNALDAWERTPIRIAAGFNRISLEFLSMLVQHGADIDRRDIYGQSPLLKSIQGTKEATQLLLYHGANAEARDEYGNTPILEAIYRDKPCRLRILLEHGAKIDEPFELKPGRPARSGPIHLLDFIAWYGGIEVMRVIEEMLDCFYNLCYPNETVEASRDFRLANGRKAGEKEFEAFVRILSKLQLNNDSQDSDAESYSDAHE